MPHGRCSGNSTYETARTVAQFFVLKGHVDPKIWSEFVCPGGTSAISRWLSGATPPEIATEKVLNPRGIQENDGWPVSFRRMQRGLNNAFVILPG
jgi:hypothetical protein